MTEYDYSPEAYERYLETQARIARWIDHTEQLRLNINSASPSRLSTTHSNGGTNLKESNLAETRRRAVDSRSDLDVDEKRTATEFVPSTAFSTSSENRLRGKGGDTGQPDHIVHHRQSAIRHELFVRTQYEPRHHHSTSPPPSPPSSPSSHSDSATQSSGPLLTTPIQIPPSIIYDAQETYSPRGIHSPRFGHAIPLVKSYPAVDRDSSIYHPHSIYQYHERPSRLASRPMSPVSHSRWQDDRSSFHVYPYEVDRERNLKRISSTPIPIARSPPMSPHSPLSPSFPCSPSHSFPTSYHHSRSHSLKYSDSVPSHTSDRSHSHSHPQRDSRTRTRKHSKLSAHANSMLTETGAHTDRTYPHPARTVAVPHLHLHPHSHQHSHGHVSYHENGTPVHTAPTSRHSITLLPPMSGIGVVGIPPLGRARHSLGGSYVVVDVVRRGKKHQK